MAEIRSSSGFKDYGARLVGSIPIPAGLVKPAPPFHPLGKIGLMLKRALLAGTVFAVLVGLLAADPMHAASVSMLAALTFVRL